MNPVVVVFVFVGAFCCFGTTQPDLILQVASNGSVGELKLLLEKGVDINTRNEQGMTPLMRAVVAKNEGTARYLLENRCTIDVADSLGHDALDWALVTGNLIMARLLVDHGADVNRMNRKGHPRLTSMILMGNAAAIQFLLGVDADIDAVSGNGMTPKKAAAKVKRSDITAMLEETGKYRKLVESNRNEHPSSPASQTAHDSYVARYYDCREMLLKDIQNGRKSFVGVDFRQLDLSRMNLMTLDLRYCDFSGCDFRHANLSDANLQGANLKAAYLRKATLCGADLADADFTNAYLTATNLTDVRGLTKDQLRLVRNAYDARMEEWFHRYMQKYFPSKMSDPGYEWDTNLWWRGELEDK